MFTIQRSGPPYSPPQMVPDQEQDSARSRSDPSDQQISSCRIGTLWVLQVWSEAQASLAAQSARLCVPAHRGAARVRGDHGRRVGNPHPDLARKVPDRTAGAPADRRRDEVGGRHGLPTGQPGGRCPRAGPRAAADRRPAHAGAAPRRGGGRPRDRANLPGDRQNGDRRALRCRRIDRRSG